MVAGNKCYRKRKGDLGDLKKKAELVEIKWFKFIVLSIIKISLLSL